MQLRKQVMIVICHIKVSSKLSCSVDNDHISFLGKSVQTKPEFDEFGRDKSGYMEQAKQRRAVEREARRNRRKKEREAAMLKEDDSKQYHEGFSSDDEEGSGEILRFKSESGTTLISEINPVRDSFLEC